MMWRRVLKFGLIGALATLVHIIIGAILIQSGQPPLIANALAFATAFLVSFVGHLGYSFADQNPDPANSLWRFGLVALAGFLCNETLLALLLGLRWLPDAVALGVSTTCAAILTFGLSKCWAFRGEPPDPLPTWDNAPDRRFEAGHVTVSPNSQTSYPQSPIGNGQASLRGAVGIIPPVRR